MELTDFHGIGEHEEIFVRFEHFSLPNVCQLLQHPTGYGFRTMVIRDPETL